MSILKHAPSIAASIAALSLSGAALAEAIIVRSTGPSAAAYPVGRRMPTTQRIVLRAGDRVVLVGEGPSRTLSGPGSFPVRSTTTPSSGGTNTLGRYLSATGGTISRTGASRGPGSSEIPASAPNLWVVDIARGGTRCVFDTSNVTLWRADMSEDTLLMVEDVADSSRRNTLAFVSGQNFRRWPSDAMPIRAGSSYRISGPGLAQPTTISFVAIGAAPTDVEAAANTLAEHGCTTQLAQLGDQLAQ
ncbi:MAG: hypothetical protein ABL909_11430 [Sphingopyxis sp.]